jgi:hypothetical protein
VQAPTEKRYLEAMKADYSQMDVVSKPLVSAEDFEARLQDWLREVDVTMGRDQAMVVYFNKVKDDLTKTGINFAAVVQATCQR